MHVHGVMATVQAAASTPSINIKVFLEKATGGSTGCRNACGFMAGLNDPKDLFQPK